MASSVQPAFKNRSSRVSGKLHRRNQPAFKPYASDQPVLKKIAGPTCHICLLPALPASVSLLSSRRCRPTRSLHTAAFPSRRRRTSTPPPCARAATTVRRSRTLAAPPVQPLCAACACSRRRRLHFAPAPPARAFIAQRRRAPRHPRAQSRSFHTSSSPRSRAAFAFSRRSSTQSALTRCSRF